MVGYHIPITLLLIGVLIGLISSIPLGPINLALITTALQMDIHRSIAMAGAVALVDGLYAFAAVSTLSILHTSLMLRRPIELAGALLVVAYGLHLAFFSYKSSLADQSASPSRYQDLSLGALTGVALYVSNPTFAVFWLSVAGVLHSRIPATSLLAERLSFGTGVMVGTAVWFGILLYMVRNISTSLYLSPVVVRRLSITASCLLIGFGGYVLISRLSRIL
jgi:L-lysine exporter family protein LysE/ArgO